MTYQIRKTKTSSDTGEIIATAESRADAATAIRRWADANAFRVFALDFDDEEDGVDAFLVSARNPNATLILATERL